MVSTIAISPHESRELSALSTYLFGTRSTLGTLPDMDLHLEDSFISLSLGSFGS